MLKTKTTVEISGAPVAIERLRSDAGDSPTRGGAEMSLDFICRTCGVRHTWGSPFCKDNPDRREGNMKHVSEYKSDFETIQRLTFLLESARGQNTSLILENEKLRERIDQLEDALAENGEEK